MDTAGVRRLWALVEGLPPEATVWAAATPHTPSGGGTARDAPVENRRVLKDPEEMRKFFSGLGLMDEKGGG